MFTFVLSVVLIGYFLSFFFKTDKNVLTCGIFGGGFNRPITEDILNKIKTLGFMNQSRGEHSCGYYNGESIFKGVDKTKKFIDLVTTEGIKLPDFKDLNNNIFIGHTRQATYGEHNAENAHPFNIDNNLILAHNGTIKNIWSLCSKNNESFVNINVDSKALGILLNKKGYSILNEYEGAAALAIHKTTEPNILYLYHGSSKEEENGLEIEERPLFVLETEEGTYFSSLDYALSFIKRDTEKVRTLSYNRIIRINNGKLEATKTTIDRGSCNVKKVYKNYHNAYYNEYEDYYTPAQKTLPFSQKSQDDLITNIMKKYPNTTLIGSSVKKDKYDFNILSSKSITNIMGIDANVEATPAEALGSVQKNGKVFYKSGRYWILKPSSYTLANGRFFISKTGLIVPNEEVIASTESRISEYCFYKGVLIKTKEEYTILEAATSLPVSTDQTKHPVLSSLKFDLEKSYYSFARTISKFSMYPVYLLPDESMSYTKDRHLWYLNEKPFSSAITPKFSKRDYHFKDGLLIKVVTNNTDDKKIILDIPLLSEPAKPLVNTKTNSMDLYKKYNEGSDIDNKTNSFSEDDSASLSAILEVFNSTYTSEEVLITALTPLGLTALRLYSEDFICDVLNNKEGTDDETELISMRHIKDAIFSKSSLSSVLHSDLSSAKNYILDAIIIQNNDAFKNDDDYEEEINNIEKTQEENEQACDILEKVAHNVSEIYKNLFDLQLLSKSSFAQEICADMQKELDQLTNNVLSSSSKAKMNETYSLFKKMSSLI